MILGTFTAGQPGSGAALRSYCDMFTVKWWTHSVIQYGQYTILQEVPFGGYRVHIKFTDAYWNWNSDWWLWDRALEFCYATAPGSGTPISFGNATWEFKGDSRILFGGLTSISLVPSDNHYTAVALPKNPGAFWYQSPKDYPAVQQYTL